MFLRYLSEGRHVLSGTGNDAKQSALTNSDLIHAFSYLILVPLSAYLDFVDHHVEIALPTPRKPAIIVLAPFAPTPNARLGGDMKTTMADFDW